MPNNISISLDRDNLEYLDTQVKNRSKYINQLIAKDRQEKFAELMKQGYLSQNKDPEVQEEDRLWEITTGDGIDETD
ncbi:MAG: hypothetical protein AAGE84_15875 [Cyanobacteria bacterium P01_G01_bin.39]